VESADAGDIVLVAGLEEVVIGDTLADPESPDALPRIEIEEPTVRITIGVNTSPFSGREGQFSTSRQLRARLLRELKVNLGLRVEETDSADRFLVSGRGELHLAVLSRPCGERATSSKSHGPKRSSRWSRATRWSRWRG
jgi:GTP-binding protein